MNIEDYITTRVDKQIEWYDKKSIICQKAYKRIQTFEICAAALIPLLSGYSFSYTFIPVLIGSIGVIITIFESISKLNRYHENWIEYRSTCELMKYQKYLFLTKSFPYSLEEGENIENLFVKNIEQFISTENNQWKIMNFRNLDKLGKRFS